MEHLLSNLAIKSFATRDEQQVAGYAELMDLVGSSWQDIPFTENHVKQLHQVLLRFSEKDTWHRGNYKTNPNSVAAFDAVFFLRSLAEQVRRLERKVEREKLVLAALPELQLQIVEFASEHERVRPAVRRFTPVCRIGFEALGERPEDLTIFVHDPLCHLHEAVDLLTTRSS